MSDTSASNTSPGTDPSTPPVTPEEQAELDRLANDELYQTFLQQETQTNATPGAEGDEETTEGTSDTTTPSGEEGQEPGDPGGVAPTPGSPGTTDDEEEGEGGEGDTGGERQTPSAGVVTLGPLNLNQEQAVQAAGLYQWATNLSPEQQVLIDAALSGEYDLVPRTQTPSPYSPPTSQTPSPTPPFDDDPDLDPAVATRLQSLDERIQHLSQETEARRQHEQETQRQALIEAVNKGTESFRTTYGLTSEEAQALQQRVVGMQVLPSYAAMNPGNPAQAMTQALEALYWTTPEYRQREMEKQLELERRQRTTVEQKGRKASSLTGNGGSIPRTDPATPATREGRMAGMTAALAEAINGRGQDTPTTQ